MRTTIDISNMVTVINPPPEFLKYVQSELELSNPDYEKKKRMGFWTGNIPKKICLYEEIPGGVRLPYGLLKEVLARCPDSIKTTDFPEVKRFSLKNVKGVPLYDYQEEAVSAAQNSYFGILKSKAGSGKTQMGIELIRRLSRTSLWVVHTKDLLNQSLSRAKQFFPAEMLGTITEGKVSIGSAITFATVQTLANVDLERYRDEWDVIIVDECHRVAGTPTTVTRYSKVLNTLRARRKYGLTATDHRADGLEKATHALLGDVFYEVPTEAVADKVVPIVVHPCRTKFIPGDEWCDTDGTITYTNLMNATAEDEERNRFIAYLINNVYCAGHSVLVLSCRKSQLHNVRELLPGVVYGRSCVITGDMTSKAQKAKREQYIEEMRSGDKRILFATYQLAKEGLDIPILDVLIMATPEKDEAVIVQSIGRVGRAFTGKDHGTVYDLVDNTASAIRSFRARKRIYNREGCTIEDG